MVRIYKKQVVNELINMKDIDTAPIIKLIERKTSNLNKIIRLSTDKKKANYICTNCNHYSYEYEKVNLHTKFKCPNCGKKLEVIGFHNKIEPINDYITVFDINERNELICRLFHFKKIYDKELFSLKTYCFEVVRMNVDRDIAVKKDTYWCMGHGWRHARDVKGWALDRKNFHSFSNYRFSDAAYYDIVLCRNLKKLISKTKYKYSALDIIARHGGIDTIEYLRLWEKYPSVELLAKAGCFNLIKDKLTNYLSVGIVDIQMCMKNKNAFKYVIKNDLRLKEAMIACEYNILDKKMISKAIKCRFDMSVSHNEAIKIIDYLSIQKENCTEYKDYIEFVKKIGMDIEDKKVRFPKNLKKAHDEAEAKYEVVKNKINEENIHNYSEELKKYLFEDEKLIIRPATSINELMQESKILKHCVRTYYEKMANRETAIFFIRNKNNPGDPFYTLELKDGKIIQVRGKKNCSPTDNVNIFVKNWENYFNLSGW